MNNIVEIKVGPSDILDISNEDQLNILLNFVEQVNLFIMNTYWEKLCMAESYFFIQDLFSRKEVNLDIDISQISLNNLAQEITAYFCNK